MSNFPREMFGLIGGRNSLSSYFHLIHCSFSSLGESETGFCFPFKQYSQILLAMSLPRASITLRWPALELALKTHSVTGKNRDVKNFIFKNDKMFHSLSYMMTYTYMLYTELRIILTTNRLNLRIELWIYASPSSCGCRNTRYTSTRPN